MKAHDAYSRTGRQGLRRVVNYERRRFGWVRASVAERILTALEDVHACPAACDPVLFRKLNELSSELWNGNVAAVALCAVDLVDRASVESDRLFEERRKAVERRVAS